MFCFFSSSSKDKNRVLHNRPRSHTFTRYKGWKTPAAVFSKLHSLLQIDFVPLFQNRALCCNVYFGSSDGASTQKLTFTFLFFFFLFFHLTMSSWLSDHTDIRAFNRGILQCCDESFRNNYCIQTSLCDRL